MTSARYLAVMGTAGKVRQCLLQHRRLSLLLALSLCTYSYADTYPFQLDSCQYRDGPITLTAKAYDDAGNVGTYTQIVYVANRPSAAITYPIAGTKVGGQVTIKGTSFSGCSCTQSLTIDGKQVASGACGQISYTWFATKAGKGVHTITLTATDVAGDSGVSQITVSV